MSVRNWLDRHLNGPLSVALVVATPWASAKLFAVLFYGYVHSAPLWRVIFLEGIWIIATVFATFMVSILPSALYMNSREEVEESRARLGLCQECGYDLCASKDRRPECGRPFSGNQDSPSVFSD